MWKQKNLFGQPLEFSKKSNPLEGICCEACYNAKDEKCDCRCHGAFHGLGNLNNQKRKRKNVDMSLDQPIGEVFLSGSQAKPFREQINDRKCDCGFGNLKDEDIRAYPHDAGWKVQGLDGLWWLSIKCPECGYEWSLWKLNVGRDFDSTLQKVEA